MKLPPNCTFLSQTSWTVSGVGPFEEAPASPPPALDDAFDDPHAASTVEPPTVAPPTASAPARNLRRDSPAHGAAGRRAGGRSTGSGMAAPSLRAASRWLPSSEHDVKTPR